MTSETLALLQVGPGLNYPLHELVTYVSERMPDFQPVLAPSITNPGEAFDSLRKQYHSTRIIVILENHASLARFERKLGLTSLDLYNPGRDGRGYVFGESRCPGSSGIVSTFRLTSSGPTLFGSRVRKEVVHELSHMLGLKHCGRPQCVMHQSETVSDMDAKMDDYCDGCRLTLGKSGS